MPNEMIVAAVTPLADAGRRLDEAAIGPMVEFLEAHGANGLFACGTTGEGVLPSIEERRRAAAAFRVALRGRPRRNARSARRRRAGSRAVG